MKKQHRHFAEAYAAVGSAKDAALMAGYSPGRAKQTGSELLRRPDVAKAVAKLQEARAASLDVDARALIDEAFWYHRAAQRGEVPASVGVRALDLAARLLGAFAPSRHEVETRKVVVSLDVKTPDVVEAAG